MSHPKDIPAALARRCPALREALKGLPIGVRAPRGGLAQVTSLPGGSKTRYALSCLGSFFEVEEKAPDPPAPQTRAGARVRAGQENPSTDYCLFASDEGLLYPEALWTQWRIPLSRLVMVKVALPEDVWRVALEAVQVGLFRWVVLRPSRSCPVSQLRKLQLSAEHGDVRVLLLTKHKLPHWVCQSSVEVNGADTLLRKQPSFASVRGSVSGADSESQYRFASSKF